MPGFTFSGSSRDTASCLLMALSVSCTKASPVTDNDNGSAGDASSVTHESNTSVGLGGRSQTSTSGPPDGGYLSIGGANAAATANAVTSTGGALSFGGTTDVAVGGAAQSTASYPRGGSSGTFATSSAPVGGQSTSAGGTSSTSGGGKPGGGTSSNGGQPVAGGPPVTGGTSSVLGLPSKSNILASLRLANDYFMKLRPDPTAAIVGPGATRPSNLWTRAVYFEGLMALYGVETDALRKTSYYNYAVTWGASPSHPWTLASTAAGALSTSADNQGCGQTYIDLYRIENKPERLTEIKANVDSMISKNNTSAWTWIDAVQMAMPVFAKLGTLLNDTRYYEQMYKLYAYTRDTLGGGTYNAQTGLWWRDDTFTPDAPTYTKSKSGNDIYWSRGNGWIMAALVRVLEEIPVSEVHRATYEADFQAMAKALIPLQRSDGYWNEALTEATYCANIGKTEEDGPEETGTGLFTYGLAWGIRNGLLDAATYAPVVSKGWTGLVTTSLHGNGFLGWVQSTGKQPCEGTEGLGYDVKPNFDDYGVGCFLLAGSEVYRLAM